MGKRNPKMLREEEVRSLELDSDVWVEALGADGCGYIHCGTLYEEVGKGEELRLYNDDIYRMSMYNQGNYGGWRIWTGRPSISLQQRIPWKWVPRSFSEGGLATNMLNKFFTT